MNLTKNISLFAVAALLFVSCKDTSKDGTIETPDNDGTVTDTVQVKETAANLETTTFTIDGMTCPMGCAATIEKKLAGLDGVESATVDYEKKTATVSFDASRQTPEKLVETVESIADGAYKVSDVKNSGDKAYYSVDQEKEKKKKSRKSKKDEASKESKTAGCGTEKKGGCCASESKKSCSSEAKGGSL